MDINSLTRYKLYREAFEFLKENRPFAIDDEYFKFAIEVFNSSSLIIENLEELEYDCGNPIDYSNFEKILSENFRNKNINGSFKEYIFASIQSKTKNKERLTLPSILRIITKYQNIVLKRLFACNKFSKKIINNNRRPITFLSYAYVDRGLTFSLFSLFLKNGGFLYVDWMFNSSNPTGTITKKKLEVFLKKSSQLLFLRTTNSEFELKGAAYVRPWCSWEIGNFYTKHKDKKFYVSFYNRCSKRDDLLDSFSPMTKIIDGIIY